MVAAVGSHPLSRTQVIATMTLTMLSEISLSLKLQAHCSNKLLTMNDYDYSISKYDTS